MSSLIDLAVPYRIPKTLHYRYPSSLEAVEVGSVVQVTLGKRTTHAFVMGFPEVTTLDEAKLKEVEQVLVAQPVFDIPTLKFLRWISEYYCHPIGEVLAAALPRNFWKLSEKQKKSREKLTHDPLFMQEMGLAESASAKPELTADQEFAVSRILDPEDKRPVLLHGVTGSGKTEVYMSVIEKQIEVGKGTIVLVPEIALTPQLVGRFSSRFPGKVAIVHSDLTIRERYVQWERVRQGIARIVVGARSAIFAPVSDLGLIVVDEEHETSYKQEDSVRYHARDVAVLRARFSEAKVVLGSATPSVESYWHAQNGKYQLTTLMKRINEKPLPKTHFVDMKEKQLWQSPQTPWLSRLLYQKIQQTLKSKQQVMLYLNRLGYAHFLFCKDCGHSWRCSNCDVTLTYYRFPPLLRCHYCGYADKPPETCTDCNGNDLDAMGLGTEQVEKQLVELLPDARIERMDRGVVKTRADLEGLLKRMARREIDVLIGTQMITKGHDFPGIALVGILSADASLNVPDFRAHERTFQVITQVSGRAGRADIPGEVVVQSMNPDHPILQAASEYRCYDYYRMEIDTRKAFEFPPFSRMAMIRFEHRQAHQLEKFATELCHVLTHTATKRNWDCSVIGPSEAPISKIKNVCRWQSLIKSSTIKDLHQMLAVANQFHAHQKAPVKMIFDVDPVSVM